MQVEQQQIFGSGGEIEASLSEHDEIIDHIASGYRETAALAARESWRNAAALLAGHFQTMFGRGG